METQNTTTAQEPKPVRGQGVLEWYEALISAALVLVLVFSFFFRIIQVDGSSMVPTLVNGDKLIVWGAGYTPQRGDVVIVDSSYFLRQTAGQAGHRQRRRHHLHRLRCRNCGSKRGAAAGGLHCSPHPSGL